MTLSTLLLAIFLALPLPAAKLPATLVDSVMEFGGFSKDETQFAYKLRRSYSDNNHKESWHLKRTQRTVPGLATPVGVRLENHRFPGWLTEEGFDYKTINGSLSADHTTVEFKLPDQSSLRVALLTEKTMVVELTLTHADGKTETLGRFPQTEIWFEIQASLHLSPKGRKAAVIVTCNGDIMKRSEIFVVVLK